MRSVWAVLAVACFFSIEANSQPISGFKALQCNFTFGHALRLDADGVKSSPDSFSTPITIAAIDFQNSTAQMVGNVGASNLAIVRGNSMVSFIETVPNGGVVVISVHGNASSQQFFGTLSRSINLLGTPMASSYFGICSGLR